MATRVQVLPDIIIANGAQNSQSLEARSLYEDGAILVIASPSTLPETVVPQASFDGGTTWYNIEDTDGTDITLPAAGKARAYFNLGAYPHLRLRASVAVAAQRSFEFVKLWAS